jgi:hypothetical protein
MKKLIKKKKKFRLTCQTRLTYQTRDQTKKFIKKKILKQKKFSVHLIFSIYYNII